MLESEGELEREFEALSTQLDDIMMLRCRVMVQLERLYAGERSP